MSSAISSILLVMVLATRQISLGADRIKSSPIVNGFLALAIRLATKYDALSALAFVDVVALSYTVSH